MGVDQNHCIAFLTPMAPETRAVLKSLVPNGFEMIFANSNDRSEHQRMLTTAEYIFVSATDIDGDLIRSAPRLKMIQKWGVGIDRIDLQAAAEKGITVAITNGANAIPVAEHTIMLILATLRKLPLAHNSLIQGQWLTAKLRAMCFQLEGKTVGLFGFGNIAQAVSKRLAGFNVRILYHSRTPVSSTMEQDLGVSWVDLDTLFMQSDILSIHATLNSESRHIINAEALRRMKPSAILINTSRGDLVDEAALIQALQNGHLRGAGLDTFSTEPLSKDSPLLNMDQVVVTPHSGASVFEVVAKIGEHAMSNILRFERGLPLDPADIILMP
jgi:D-3-phosphoglycerate dehydrogenase